MKLYGHLALRQFCDLDILVRPREWAEAGRLIAAQGFEPHFLVPEKMRAAFVRQDYAQLFHRDDGPCWWSCIGESLRVSLPSSSMRMRCGRAVNRSRCRARRCLCRARRTCCASGACTEPGTAGTSWRACAGSPSCCGVRGRLTGSACGRKSREMHCRRMLGFGLLLAHGLFDVPLPPQAAAIGRSRTLLTDVVRNFDADDVPAPTFSRQAAFDLRLKDSAADRVRYCARIGLMSTPDDWLRCNSPARCRSLTRWYAPSGWRENTASTLNRRQRDHD